MSQRPIGLLGDGELAGGPIPLVSGLDYDGFVAGQGYSHDNHRNRLARTPPPDGCSRASPSTVPPAPKQ